jgi:hypothetical protein
MENLSGRMLLSARRGEQEAKRCEDLEEMADEDREKSRGREAASPIFIPAPSDGKQVGWHTFNHPHDASNQSFLNFSMAEVSFMAENSHAKRRLGLCLSRHQNTRDKSGRLEKGGDSAQR